MRTVFLAPLAACSLFALTSVAAAGPLSEIKVDVNEKARPVREVLRNLESAHRLDYVVAEDTLARAGMVTVRLRQVPLDDALHAICTASGLSLELRGRIAVILPRRVPSLPPVRADRGSGERVTERRADPRASAQPDPRPELRPRPLPAPTRLDLARAVGNVLEVDRENRRLVLNVDGLKRDFFLPTSIPGAGQARVARLEAAFSRLTKGHRVALEYRYEEKRSLIHNLVGGDVVRDSRLALNSRRRAKPQDDTEVPETKLPARKRVDGPRNPKTAPEGKEVPDGVLAGNFVSYADGTVKVKRGDGEVIEVDLPTDPGLRARVLSVVEQLQPDAKVFLILGDEDGKQVIKTTGLTEVKPKK